MVSKEGGEGDGVDLQKIVVTESIMNLGAWVTISTLWPKQSWCTNKKSEAGNKLSIVLTSPDKQLGVDRYGPVPHALNLHSSDLEQLITTTNSKLPFTPHPLSEEVLGIIGQDFAYCFQHTPITCQRLLVEEYSANSSKISG